MKLKKDDLIKIGKMIEENNSASKIAIYFGLNKSTVKSLIQRYRKHGIEGILHKEESYSFTQEYKLEIINRYYSGESQRSLAIELNVNHSVIQSWIKKYEQFGYNGLIDKRGSPGMTKRGRPRKNETRENDKITPLTNSEREELNELRKRNRRLEMELEATKKLQALIQERINRQTKKK